MPHYYSLGQIPRKRHIQFRKPDGALYSEQLVSTEGFSDIYSLVYHIHEPTLIAAIGEPWSVMPEIELERNMQHRSFQGFHINPADDYMKSRVPVLVNADVHLSLAAPTRGTKGYFYKNAMADEIILIHEGEGRLISMYGQIQFTYGDQLVIPRGTTYQIEFNHENNRLFIVESFTPVRFPKRYINNEGQLLEHAPFCERDIRKPLYFEPHNETGSFPIFIKKQNLVYPYHYKTHPFDVVGWDGCLYPYSLSMLDFEPITGRIHQPPPVHQVFETSTFVVCNFVPRLFDYHPLSIPVPYNHSNVDSDEVLYYVDGNFMSRKNVSRGQITLHPMGIPHGPHPGTVEKSLGTKETKELAFMVDTFKPLMITRQAMEIEVEDYYRSWL